MSGSIGGPKIDGSSYDRIRDQMTGAGVAGGKHVRGEETGGVYLHKGLSRFGEQAKLERQDKQAQGARNVFEALSAKVGEDYAKLLFQQVGKERGRDLMTEFKVSDFDRIEKHRQNDEGFITPKGMEIGGVLVRTGSDGGLVRARDDEEEKRKQKNV